MPRRRRDSVVRKLTLVVIATVTLVIAATGLVNSIISNHYALESARSVLQFNSQSILSGIEKLMMSRNNAAVLELIQDISKGSTVYQDIRLVAHHSGEIVVSRLDEPGATLTEEDPSCAICHDLPEPLVASPAPLDELTHRADGARILHVITPVMNQPRCKTGKCHEHADSGPILGFLQAEYFMGEIDKLIFGLNASFVVAASVAILLGTVALWIMFKQSLDKPIRYMLGGIQAISGSDLSFRFRSNRGDEFGLVEESFDDMATRIQAHQMELRAAREYLEGIVENSADIIITVNPDGLIQTVNRGAEQALGYRREELIGERIERLFADPRERDAAIAKLDNKDSVTNYETRFLTKNGSIRNVLLTLSRLRDREGRAIGTIGISKDMTREKELQGIVAQLQTAAAIGGAMTAIQHAVKNMLNTLAGGSYLVRRGMEKDDRRGMRDGIDMIDEGISTITNLSLNMLKYAKEWTLELRPTDLTLLIESVCKAIEQTASGRNVAIRRDLPSDLQPISCDSRLLHMALMDIATNALDACAAKRYKGGESPEVAFRVRLKEGAELINIEVADNGIGMTEEVRAKVFKPFFSTKRDSGTGLGLAVTARIVRLHGGDIDLESEPGRGTTFRIALPLEGKGANQGAEDE